ncbi:MAG: metallophosphoesterase, partial [Acidobacteria bacterium]|nr:metallophosphoesterase [Acidobacteriota bacterium]
MQIIVSNNNRLGHRIFPILALLLFAFVIYAAPQDSKTSKSTKIFAVIGDTGTGDEAQMSVARQMVGQREKYPFDFVLMLGDNIYETGDRKYIKTHFEDPYKDLLSADVKFYAVLGNHDIIKGIEFQTNYKNFNMDGK